MSFTLVSGDSIMSILSIVATGILFVFVGIHTYLCIKTLRFLNSSNTRKQKKP
jgi:hypothetical protein